jgi:hypothetical protein
MPTIILNSTNVVNAPTNNKLVYTFQNGGVSFTNNDIALAQLSLYYSWFNINQPIYNNNTCSYIWIDGTVVNIIIPNGYYSAQTLNAYIESVMVANNHYLINTVTGDFVYYIQLQENVTFYAIQLNCYAVPTTLGTTYTFPVGATWTLPLTPTTPQFVVNSTSNFGLLIGFNAGSYPPIPQATTYSIISQTTPQIQPISSLNLVCSIINNPFSVNRTLYSCGIPAVQFGQQISITPPNFLYNKIVNGVYQQFTIDILDQNNNPIEILDNQIVIVLNIREQGNNQ